MSILLRGGEFIATEALTESVLMGLTGLARRRALLINGIKFAAEDLAILAAEAQQTGRPVWLRASTGNQTC